MTNETVFQAVFETEKHTVFVAYSPGPDGVIFIEDVTIEPRPVTLFQERRAKIRRGLVLSDEEQHSEAMQPTTRREAGKVIRF